MCTGWITGDGRGEWEVGCDHYLSWFSPRGGQPGDARPAGARSTPGSTATRRTRACTRRCARASTPGTSHPPRPRTASRRCCAACWAWTWTRPRRACSPGSSRPRSARSPRCGAARALRQGEGRGRVSYPAPAVRRARAGSCSQLPGSIALCPGPATAGRARRWRMFRQPAALQGCWRASASVVGAGCSALPSPLQGAGSLWGESSL